MNAPSSICRSRATPTGGCRSCSSLAMWLGTDVAACTSPTGCVADRADRQVVGMSQGGDPQEVGHAPDRRGLDDVDRPGRQQWAVLLQPGQVLAGGHRGPDPSSDHGQAFGVPAPHGLLDPGEVQGALQFADVADRLFAGPRLVRVEHQAGPHPVAGLESSTSRTSVNRSPIPLDVEAAFELGRPQASLGVGLVDGDQLVIGRARCPDRTRRRAPSGRVRPAAATAVPPRPLP